jgi:cell division protein FtsW (lipid II flippase)
MAGRTASVVLLVVPAVGLAALDLAIVASAGSRPGPPGLGAPDHYAVRQAVGIVLGGALGWVVVRVGVERVLRAAPALFRGRADRDGSGVRSHIGVRAAGASRWLRLGPFSGNPAPFLIGATGLLVAAWRSSGASAGGGGAGWRRFASRPLALALRCSRSWCWSRAGLLGRRGRAVRDVRGARRHSASRVAAGSAAVVVLIALALGASRFGMSAIASTATCHPESDRRGHGFEVLALARAKASGAAGPAGLGHGAARRHLSSPASDYVFAVVNEELGRRGAWAVVGRGSPSPRARCCPHGPREATHACVASRRPCAAACWRPCGAAHRRVPRVDAITGVTMPFLSYDPALAVASGGEIGVLVAIALAGDPKPAPAADTADGPIA